MRDPLQDRGRLAEALHLIELEAVDRTALLSFLMIVTVARELGAKLVGSGSRAPGR